MASLNVRRIDDRVFEKLRARAAEHGVSIEEEVRQIIHRAVAAPQRLGELAVRCFGPSNGIELELPQRLPHDPRDLTG